MNLTFDNLKWGDFYLSEFFNFEKGNQNNMAILEDGQLPLVSAKKCDNGYKQFITPNQKKVFSGGILTLNNDGDGGAGIAYYQPADMALDSHCTALIPKFPMSRFHLLFCAMCITKQRDRFGHGYSLNSSRLRSFKIMLPMTENGKADWQFMEDYMQQTEQLILQPTLNKLCKRLIINEIVGGGKSCLSNLCWKEFYFTDIFTEVQRGKRLKKADHKDGQIPYVSSTAQGNGIDGFIGNESGIRIFEDCLTIANSGSVGSAFYHQYKLVASDHVTQLKREGLDRYAYLFMIPLISRLSEKYSFNREINDERIKREKLILPATKNGEPDFAFMSSFMKQVEQDILHTTLPIMQRRLNLSKSLGGVKINELRPFYIGDIFSIENCKCSKVTGIGDGDTPYIGATNNNNGVMKFIERRPSLLTKGNCIVFICDGEGSIGLSVYKHEDFIGTTTVKVGRCPQLNRYTGMFITTVADTVRGKYNFGYKRNEKNLKKETILLPVTSDGKPDWQLMEDYMRDIESQQIAHYLSSKLTCA